MLHRQRALARRSSEHEERVGLRFSQAWHRHDQEPDRAAVSARAIFRHGQQATGHCSIDLHIGRTGGLGKGWLIVGYNSRRRWRRQRCRGGCGALRDPIRARGRLRRGCSRFSRRIGCWRRCARLATRGCSTIGQPFEPVKWHAHQLSGPIIGARQHAQHAALRRQREQNWRRIGTAVDFGDRHHRLPPHILPGAVGDRGWTAVQRSARQRRAKVGKEGKCHILPARATWQHRLVGTGRATGGERSNGKVSAERQRIALGDDLRKRDKLAPALAQRTVTGSGEQSTLRRCAQSHGQRLGQWSGRVVGEGQHHIGASRRPVPGAHDRHCPVEPVIHK